MKENWENMIQVIPQGLLIIDKATAAVNFVNPEMQKIFKLDREAPIEA